MDWGDWDNYKDMAREIEVHVITIDGAQHLRLNGYLKRNSVLIKSETIADDKKEGIFGRFMIYPTYKQLEALKKEKDVKSKERLKECKDEIKSTKDKLDVNMVVWEREKEAVNNVSILKEKLEDAKFQMESHQRDSNYTEASKFQYETIPDLEKTIEEHTKTLENTRFVKLEVTTEDIAEVISKWTGIPVNKMLEGEKEKLLQLGVILELVRPNLVRH